MGEKIILVICDLLIKGTRFIELKKEDKEKSKSQPEETIAEIVKLRRQKADDKDYSGTSSLEANKNYDDFDEFIDIPDMPPL